MVSYGISFGCHNHTGAEVEKYHALFLYLCFVIEIHRLLLMGGNLVLEVLLYGLALRDRAL